MLEGSNDLVSDVKVLYLYEFEEARIEYNNLQTRNDRKIDNYFNNISKNNKSDLACEIIIELGDIYYWSDKSLEFKFKMVDVFKNQIKDLKEIIPNFKIANATVHLDESSPHLHIIGVPVKEKNKNGMKKQVGKTTIFTKESLSNIQDKMRLKCIESFNKKYKTNHYLKNKEQGRNYDINVKDMENYNELKKEFNKNKKHLDKLNTKTNEINNNSLEIKEMISNLKSNLVKRDSFNLTSYEKNKLLNFINDINDTTADIKNLNKLNLNLYKVESDIEKLNNEVNHKNKQIKSLNESLNNKNYENKILEKALNNFKNKWDKLLFHFKRKLLSLDSNYKEVYKNLEKENIIDEYDKEDIEKEKYL